MLMAYGLFVLIGALAGVLAGLFGIGGAIIAVPGLLFVFSTYLLAIGNNMHVAIGTALAGMIITLLAAVYSHQKRAAIIWPMVYKTLPGMGIGTFLGAVLAGYLPSSILKSFFAVFLLIIAVRLFLLIKPNPKIKIPEQGFLFLTSLFIGLIAGLLGVAGGTLIIPFLLRYSVSLQQAAGTAAACGLVITLIGMLSFMMTGWLVAVQLPADSIGFIYWPAAILVGMTSALFVPIGGWLALKLPVPLMKRIFAVVLVLTAIKLIY